MRTYTLQSGKFGSGSRPVGCFCRTPLPSGPASNGPPAHLRGILCANIRNRWRCYGRSVDSVFLFHSPNAAFLRWQSAMPATSHTCPYWQGISSLCTEPQGLTIDLISKMIGSTSTSNSGNPTYSFSTSLANLLLIKVKRAMVRCRHSKCCFLFFTP